MNTLSNVHTPRGRTTPPDIGFTSDVILQKGKLLKGVSVRYAPNPNKQWYVLRVTYNRQDKAYDYIVNDHTEAYLPMHYVLKEDGGKMKRILEPLLPNFLFVYATPSVMESYVKRTPQLSYISYYYNHFQIDNGKNPPLTIPYEDMMNFIRLCSVRDEHIMVVDEAHCRYKNGDNVVVTQGKFQGVRGKVARVCGQQRVVVNLEGVCLLATAYIPSAFIRRT